MEDKKPIWINKSFDLKEYRKTYPLYQNRFREMKISIASPDQIESWSSGEVTRSETVNYKTGKGEKDGLFCEKIFGPTKNFECACGKYKKAWDKNIKVCEQCGVAITDKIVRRQRMGHIKLEEPVAHIWFFKVPGAQAITALLDGSLIKISSIQNGEEIEEERVCNLKNSMIEAIIYYQSHILINMGNLTDNSLTTKALKPFAVLSTNDRQPILDLIEKLLIREIKTNEGIVSPMIETLTQAVNNLRDKDSPFNLLENFDIIEEATGAKFMTGARAIKYLLEKIDLQKNLKRLKEKLHNKKVSSSGLPKLMLKKIDFFESFCKNNIHPSWMILENLPVIPADLRPMISLEGGRYSTTEINDLYRKVLIRNNKLKRNKEVLNNGGMIPKAIRFNAMRLLQESVDTLLDNKKKTHPVSSKKYVSNKRGDDYCKSLADVLLGKKGRFRQNLLGKRVDFSARSVITVGPKQKLFECGLPKEHALKLYKPFIIAKLIEENSFIDENGVKKSNLDVKRAEELIEEKHPSIWNAVNEALKDRPVLLNRAPTLHRLGLQAFEPKLVEGRAIQLHPLSTAAFNADFDGDQMAVHLPLSIEAVNEARTRMIGSANLLGPKDGKPIAVPSQDMTLGLYYLTMEKSKRNYEETGAKYVEEEVKGEGYLFATASEAIVAYENKVVGLHTIIGVRVSGLDKTHLYSKEDQNKILRTTIGKLLFNRAISIDCAYINNPKQLKLSVKHYTGLYDNVKDFIEAVKNYVEVNDAFGKKFVTSVIGEIYSIAQEKIQDKYKLNSVIAEMLDKFKNLGFKYSTESGISISQEDIFVPQGKTKILEDANKRINSLNKYREKGQYSKADYTATVVKLWNDTKIKLQNLLVKELKKDKTNSVYLMAVSGARGNESNFTQLMGMRGIMTNPQGEAIAIPVKSSFKEGLSINEFFISTHGARKGNVDTARKTGVAGYMTRIFIDSCQNVIIEEEEFDTMNTYPMRAITERQSKASTKETIIVPLEDRIFGRVSGETIKQGNKILVKEGEYITREIANSIINADIEEVRVFSVLTSNGVTQKSYGLDLATNKPVELNTAVGVIAAQAIGEPGTQLTMNTFHTGGVADDRDITQGLPLIENIIKFQRLGIREVEPSEDVITKVGGKVVSIKDNTKDNTWSKIEVIRNVKRKENGKEIVKIDKQIYNVRKAARIIVKVGDKLEAGERLTEGYAQLYKIWKYAGIKKIFDETLKTFHKVYRQQGIEISDKYFEIVIKQMTSKIRIISPGETNFISGQYVELREYTKVNKEIFEQGKTPAFGRLWILSSVQSSLLSDSFLWAVSFQETTQYLAKAAIKSKVDYLLGLKENVIFGNLIPVGTGKLKREEIIFKDNAKNLNKY